MSRDALLTFARYGVSLFWLRQVMFVGATLGTGLLLNSAVPIGLYVVCLLAELLEFRDARRVLASVELSQTEIQHFTARAEWIAAFSSLAILLYAATVAAMEPTAFHFMSFFYMFAAALYAAMFNHMLTRLIVIRTTIYLVGFIGIASWEILDDWPRVETAAYVQVIAVTSGAVFLMMNAREFVSAYSERSARNAELLERQRQFHDYVRTASDLFFETDAALSVTFVSPVAGRLASELTNFESSPEKKLSRLLREETPSILANSEQHSSFRDVAITLGQIGRPRLHLLVSGVPMISNTGVFQGYRGTIRDVTDFVESHELAEDLRVQLSHSERLRSLGELSGGVAHDFNNILSVVQGNLELLLKIDRLSPDLRDLVQEAHAATVRGGKLTKDLLALGRKAQLQPELLDLAEVTEFVTGLLRRSFPSSVRLVVHAPKAGQNTMVLADRALLEHAILNIAINARDALPGRGEIHFSVRSELQDWICLDVRDTGVGMDAETLRRAVDPYFTTKPFRRGSGIGLSVVQGFLDQSGGELILESTPGIGTCVTMRFHAASAAKEMHLSPEEEQLATQDGHETVLLIEDEPAVLKVTTRMLQHLGYEVHPAEDAAAALALLAGGLRPSVVISDVDMPGEHDGLALAQILELSHPGLPVLLMSGYVLDSVARVSSPFRRALQKPISAAQLSDEIRSLLHSALQSTVHSSERPSAS
jgi:signal transduction histidine kinase/CheY-like chemotaxis protein